MNKKRILLVDDDKDILFIVGHSIKRLDPSYEVITVQNGTAALDEIKKNKIDLVLTDHMMPEMTGLVLAQTIREIAPQVKIVLMTAYDAHRMSAQIEPATLDGYISKPFTLPEVLKIITPLLETGKPADSQPQPPSSQTPAGIFNLLQKLWAEAAADIVLLLNTNGEPVRTVGDTDPATITRLATFIADNFLAVTELASLLGDNESTFKSSYHEGSKFNIYSYAVNPSLVLTVVFDSSKKPGPIWIYTRQTAAILAELLDNRR